MKTRVLLFAIALTIAFAGCLKDGPEPQPCTYDPCQFKAPATEIAAVKNYLDSVGITATEHCSGLFYTVNEPGTGVTPEVCSSSIVARYKGTLANGAMFDSGRFSRPVSLGTGLIRGWANGIPLIKKGGKITMYVPPSLGYGSVPQRDQNNNVVIPANSITIFDVELLEVY
jgi:FKBP-type peptidyl-prolyl cis-trans isomerase FkpA